MKNYFLFLFCIALVTGCSSVTSKNVESRDIAAVGDISPNIINDFKKDLFSGRWEILETDEKDAPIFVFDEQKVSFFKRNELMGSCAYQILTIREGVKKHIALKIERIPGEFIFQESTTFLKNSGTTDIYKLRSKYVLIPNNLGLLGHVWARH